MGGSPPRRKVDHDTRTCMHNLQPLTRKMQTAYQLTHTNLHLHLRLLRALSFSFIQRQHAATVANTRPMTHAPKGYAKRHTEQTRATQPNIVTRSPTYLPFTQRPFLVPFSRHSSTKRKMRTGVQSETGNEKQTAECSRQLQTTANKRQGKQTGFRLIFTPASGDTTINRKQVVHD